MKKKRTSLIICVLVIFTLITGMDVHIEITPTASGAIIRVGGSGSGNVSTIQAGVDAASPGDTVFVYHDGSPYQENVFLNYTIDLIGDSGTPTIEGSVWVQAPNCMVIGFYFQGGGVVVYDDNCIVNDNYVVGGTAGIGIHLESSQGHHVENNAIWDTDHGIRLWGASNSRLKGNEIRNSAYSGIELEASSIIVEDNEIYNSDQFGGIHTFMYGDNITIANNTLDDSGILLTPGTNILIVNNVFIDCGIDAWDGSTYIDIRNNNLSSNGLWTGAYAENDSYFNMTDSYVSNYEWGVFAMFTGNKNIIKNCTLINNNYGVGIDAGAFEITNSSIVNSSTYDFFLLDWSVWPQNFTTVSLNTTFNKSKVSIQNVRAFLDVNWFLHVSVIDGLGNPVPNANVWVEDNTNGTFNYTGVTGPDGYVRWIEVKEYIQDKTSITKFTPHKVVAWNDTLAGYAFVNMESSKTVTIILKEGTVLPMVHKSNWISIPVISSENGIDTVLQSIEGQYDAVQWYDASDSNDPWKHSHVAKPQHMNDLNHINHSMGIWIHLTDSEDTVLVLNGTRPSSSQFINLYKGWNMVGYPSLSDKDRTTALNNLVFGTHVDAIWTYNSGAQKWEEVGDMNYFVVGKGYWIHATQDCVWEVPL